MPLNDASEERSYPFAQKAGSSATDFIAQPDGFFMLEAMYLA